MDRLEGYWRRTVAASTGRERRRLERSEVASIVKLLCADFDLRPSLVAQLGRVQEELIRWTDRQLLVFSGLQQNSRVLVRGAAGTGKTCIAAEEAKRLAAEGHRVLLTCYNRQLATFLAPLARNTPNLVVRHFHGFMADVVAEAKLGSMLPDATETDLFERLYPDLCLGPLLDGTIEPFDAIVIDEAQDLLLDSYLDVFDAALRGGLKVGTWRSFFDPNQDVYRGMGSGGLARLTDTGAATFALVENCRNTAPIATNSSLLSGVPLGSILCQEGPDVVRESYNDPETERRQVSKVLRQWLYEGVKPEDIVILSPRKLQNSCVVSGLINVSARVEPRDVQSTPGVIGFSTLSAFKGLESQAVALVDIDDIESSRGAVNAYVGTTRAQALLAVFVHTSQRDTVAARAEEFGRRLTKRAPLQR